MLTPSSVQHRPRWLWPREHGAYAELAFPLLTTFCLGRPSLSSLALALAVMTAFLAHEPLLVLLGARGGAALREVGPRARSQGALLGAVSAGAALLGLYLAQPVVGWAVAALLPGLALAARLTLAGRDKSIFGELLVALLLAFAAVPVALAAGLPLQVAACSALAWSAVFFVGTAAVHAVLARKKRGALVPSYAVVSLCAALSAAAGFFALTGQASWPLAVVPMLLVAAGALLLGVPPKRLRLLGWAMVLAHAVTALGLWLTLRSTEIAAAERGTAAQADAATTSLPCLRRAATTCG